MQRAFNRCFRTGPYVLLPCHAKSRPAAVGFTDPIQGGAPDPSMDRSAGEINNALTPTTRNAVVKAVSARCESNSSIVGLNSPERVVGATVRIFFARSRPGRESSKLNDSSHTTSYECRHGKLGPEKASRREKEILTEKSADTQESREDSKKGRGAC
jgi:hypothetical protein